MTPACPGSLWGEQWDRSEAEGSLNAEPMPVQKKFHRVIQGELLSGLASELAVPLWAIFFELTAEVR